MSEHLFVDYHFHPNFNFRSRRIGRRSGRIWNAFEKAELDIVICSEHCWKRPAESYHRMIDSRPEDARTTLLPGVEILTSEGIDIVVFGHCPSWYEDTHLGECLEPYSTSLDAVIDHVVDSKDASGFIPHPYTAGQTGVIKHFGRDGSRALASRLGAIETSNNAFADTLSFTNWLGPKMFPKTQEKMILTQQLDEGFASDLELDFVAVGSDAHCPREIGYGVHLEIGERPKTVEEAFRAMLTNQNAMGVDKFKAGIMRKARRATQSAGTTLKEFLEKRSIQRKQRREQDRD
ncbi:MAG: hypothetical protein ACI8UO_000953 [Verrucomicrobiales bacterium]